MSRAAKFPWSIFFWFVFGNGLQFFVYRWLFLDAVGADTSSADRWLALLHGLRLDSALLAIELGLLCVVAALAGSLSQRASAGYLWGLTYLHVMVCAANLLFFQERNQHLWGMFLANISEPKQIFIAVAPLLLQSPLLSSAMVIFTAVYFLAAYRQLKKLTGDCPPVIDGAGARRQAILVWLVLTAITLDPIRIKTNDWPLGWYPGFTASRYYMTRDNYLRNQAVVNPVHDFLTYELPAALRQQRRFQYSRDEALRIARSALALPQGEQPYPLLRELRANADTGIENVVLVIVEGLSESLIHHDEDRQPVTPFLRRLAKESLYFANFYQSFNSTDGSMFATVTGFPETFVERDTKDFLAYDQGGHYPSLPRILNGAPMDHYFFQGFRHRHQDYLGFLRNQNYTTFGLDYFEGRLRDRPSGADAVNALGIFDRVFLLESAEVLQRAPRRFTATLLTATSHSPWSTPKEFAGIFTNKRFNAFRYVDGALATFMARMKQSLPRYEQTLFVIVGDHTSVALDNDLAERLRVPLLIYNAKLAGQKQRWADRTQEIGSHVDIVPTILGLLGQSYCYSGMGRDLLAASAAGKGAISGNHREGYYLKNNLVLKYVPYAGTVELLGLENRRVVMGDLAKVQAGAIEEMKREYLALYETSKYLTREGDLFPLDNPHACRSAGAAASP